MKFLFKTDTIDSNLPIRQDESYSRFCISTLHPDFDNSVPLRVSIPEYFSWSILLHKKSTIEIYRKTFRTLSNRDSGHFFIQSKVIRGPDSLNGSTDIHGNRL